MLTRLLTRIIAGLKRNAKYWDFVVAHCDKKLTLERTAVVRARSAISGGDAGSCPLMLRRVRTRLGGPGGA